MTGKENTNTEERIVKCPVDRCGSENLARGIHLHIRQSEGNGHGEHGEIPEGINLSNLETVGRKDVETEYPQDREEDNIPRLCPYCNRTFQGERGIKLHLQHIDGKENHPEGISEGYHEKQFPQVSLDKDGNVIEYSNEHLQQENPDCTVPIVRAYKLIGALLAEDKLEAAVVARETLLNGQE